MIRRRIGVISDDRSNRSHSIDRPGVHETRRATTHTDAEMEKYQLHYYFSLYYYLPLLCIRTFVRGGVGEGACLQRLIRSLGPRRTDGGLDTTSVARSPLLAVSSADQYSRFVVLSVRRSAVREACESVLCRVSLTFRPFDCKFFPLSRHTGHCGAGGG